MHYQYIPQGTCSRLIEFDLDDEKCVHNVRFTGGCNGNLQGIGALVEGCPAEDIVARLRGIRCGAKPTSCPDRLADALSQAVAQTAGK